MKFIFFIYKYKKFVFSSSTNGDWGLGIGDWGLGIGDWAQSPIPNPQSPIPNPQKIYFHIKTFYVLFINKENKFHG
jgi:hypothetical protein